MSKINSCHLNKFSIAPVFPRIAEAKGFPISCVAQRHTMPGASIDSIIDFLHPINLSAISNDEGFLPHQLGSQITAYEFSFPDLSAADLVIMCCGDYR